MCGIVGYVELKNSPHCSKDIDRAIQSLEHRGPDAFGKDEFFIKQKIGLGHRRLSILDISDAGKQPMTSCNGRFRLIFNGEIYNHQEIREYINQKYNFNSWKSSSDTETLLNLFEFEDFKDALKLVKGMFAIVLFDLTNNRIYFSRDRIGEKPLYISFNEASLLFGSELGSLAQFSAFNKDLSMNSLSSYFKFNYIPAPYSIYKGTFKCPPGIFISIDLNVFTLTNTPEKLLHVIHSSRGSYKDINTTIELFYLRILINTSNQSKCSNICILSDTFKNLFNLFGKFTSRNHYQAFNSIRSL